MDFRGLSQLIDSSGLSGVSHRILAKSEPCVRITSNRVPKASFAMGVSKIGGEPDVPANFEWPKWKGLPLSFLAQIDLSELATYTASKVLANSGHLYFFYSADSQTWGFDPKDRGSWQVVHNAAPLQELRRNPRPANVTNPVQFPSCRLSFRDGITLPPRDSMGLEDLELDDAELDRYWDLLDAISSEDGEAARHQFLGHPEPLQGDMQREAQLVSHGIHCGGSSDYRHPRERALLADAPSWRLLLQLDSDENAEMMWGDSGRLYFWLQEQIDHRFDRVWMILQSA